MASRIRAVDYYALQVSDEAGEGHRILDALAGEDVNLLAVVGFPRGEGRAQIDLVPEQRDAFEGAARRLGLETREPRRCFLVQGEDDRPGAVAEVLGHLAGEKIQVTAAQAISAGAGRWSMILWVPHDRFDAAARTLGASSS